MSGRHAATRVPDSYAELRADGWLSLCCLGCLAGAIFAFAGLVVVLVG
jgi:hypothetical protein